MAINPTVQTPVKNITGSAANVVQFGSTPTIGNAVIVAIAADGGYPILTVADNQTGNTFVRVIREPDSSGGNHATAEIWWCSSLTSASGTYTVTVTPTSAGGIYTSSAIMEVSGLSGVVDQTGVAQDTAGANTSLTVTNGTVNSNANDLVVAIMSAGGGTTTGLTTPPNTGYTNILSYTSGGNGLGASGGYKVVSAVETSSAAWTWTDGAYCAGVVATFPGAAATASICWVQ